MKPRRLTLVLGTSAVAVAVAAPVIAAPAATLHATYVGPQALIAANGMTTAFAGLQPPRGLVEFAVPAHSRRLALRVVDRSGRSVAIHVVMYRGGYVDADHVDCAAGRLALRIPRSTNAVQVIPLAGECNSGGHLVTSLPSVGDVSATFTS